MGDTLIGVIDIKEINIFQRLIYHVEENRDRKIKDIKVDDRLLC
jgi:hypothetical protein